MDTLSNERDLFRLQGLAGALETVDDFCLLYEKTLETARKAHDFDMIRRLKRILDCQCVYFVSLYLRQEADIKGCEEKNEVQ
jgi:hypothetical protein